AQHQQRVVVHQRGAEHALAQRRQLRQVVEAAARQRPPGVHVDHRRRRGGLGSRLRRGRRGCQHGRRRGGGWFGSGRLGGGGGRRRLGGRWLRRRHRGGLGPASGAAGGEGQRQQPGRGRCPHHAIARRGQLASRRLCTI